MVGVWRGNCCCWPGGVAVAAVVAVWVWEGVNKCITNTNPAKRKGCLKREMESTEASSRARHSYKECHPVVVSTLVAGQLIFGSSTIVFTDRCLGLP